MAVKTGLSAGTLKAAAQAMLKVDKLTVVTAELDGDAIVFSAVSKSGAVTLSGQISEPQGELDLDKEEPEDEGSDAGDDDDAIDPDTEN